MNEICSNWQGSGWYAPRQEGAHEEQHVRWYWVGDDLEQQPRLDRSECLGTPSWFDSLFEIEGERA